MKVLPKKALHSMKHKAHLLMILSELALLFTHEKAQALDAASANANNDFINLSCTPLAISTPRIQGMPSPEICSVGQYRDELYTYLHHGEFFIFNGSRWLDRVELWPDLSENQVLLGKEKTTVRLNAYLRSRDVRDFFHQIQPRLALIKASPEYSKILSTLKFQEDETRLNLSIDIKQFLDQPFLGSGWMSRSTRSPAVLPVALSSNPKTETLSSTEKACEIATKSFDLQKKSLQTELHQFKELIDEIKHYTETIPTSMTGRPSDALSLSESLGTSAPSHDSLSCSGCQKAADFCLKKGYLGGSLPQGLNCRLITQSPSCMDALPFELRVHVALCQGVSPQILHGEIRHRIDEQNQKLSRLESQFQGQQKHCR